MSEVMKNNFSKKFNEGDMALMDIENEPQNQHLAMVECIKKYENRYVFEGVYWNTRKSDKNWKAKTPNNIYLKWTRTKEMAPIYWEQVDVYFEKSSLVGGRIPKKAMLDFAGSRQLKGNFKPIWIPQPTETPNIPKMQKVTEK